VKEILISVGMDNKHKTVIFDFFGVVCSEVASVWFAKYFEKEKALSIKEKYVRPADSGEITGKKLFEELATLSNSNSDSVREEWLSLIKIDQKMISLIKDIKGDFRIVLGSNAPSNFLRQILKENNLEKLFDTIIISSEIRVAKPDRLFFNKAMEILEEVPDNLLFFDDNQKNIEAAQKIGIQSHLFRTAEDAKFLTNLA